MAGSIFITGKAVSHHFLRMTTIMDAWQKKGNSTDDQSRHPLSSPQQEIWFDQQLHPDVPSHTIAGHVQIDGPIDPAMFEQALRLLTERHDALRIALVSDGQDELPMQTVAGENAATCPFHDFSTADDPHQAAKTWMQAQVVRPFDLNGNALFRFALLKISDDCWLWFRQCHLMILDAWSMGLITQSLADVYTCLCQGRQVQTVAPSCLRFAEADRTYVESLRYEADRQYWLEKYQTVPDALFAPRHPSRSPDQMPTSIRRTLSLTQPLHGQLTELAKICQATRFDLILGTLYVYFSRIGQTEEWVVGVPANRPGVDFRETVGSLTGLNAARFSFGTALSFKALVRGMREVSEQDQRHQSFPISDLNRALELHKQGRRQLFDVSLSYERHPHAHFGPCETRHATNLSHDSAPIPLTLRMRECADQMDVDVVGNLAYMEAAEIERMPARLMMMVEHLLDHDHMDAPISAIPLLTEEETRQLLAWSQTETDYPRDRTIAELFQSQVESTPERIATVFEGHHLSYQKLNVQANRLAHDLIAVGVTADTLVGICVERSLEMLIGLIGILKAGGAYLPLDPEYPRERLQFMVEDASLGVLLSQGHLLERLPASVGSRVILLDDDGERRMVPCSDENPVTRSAPENLAYVIHTSGSTGRPKGVSLPQAALVNLLCWQSRQHGLDRAENTLQFTTLNFDVSFQEIFDTLLIGGRLVLVDEETRRDAGALLECLSKQRVERLFVPFVMLQHLAQQVEAGGHDAPMLRNVITAGEQLRVTPALRALFDTLPRCRLHNHYGPSESHVVTALTLPSDRDAWTHLPPIGRPIANIRIHILDAYHQLQPLGVPGELCIAGVGLARGYLNRPELTAEKFVEVECLGRTERVYKTGDLARWLPDGNLECLGRTDHQVKLRGFRIELGEIESVLSQHRSVRESVVKLCGTDHDRRLAAYVTVSDERPSGTDGDSATDVPSLTTELRGWLRERLPEHMIPAHLTMLDQMPLTPNGKIDRQSLPAPEPFTSVRYEPPRDPTDLRMVQIWEELFDVRPIGITDNFFELGGSSLLALRLMSQIHHAFEKRLPLSALFQGPSIAELVGIIRQDTPTTWPTLIPIQPHGDRPPLFCFPGSGGNVLYLHPLAAHLGKRQPCYGLQSPGLDGETSPPATTEAMAALHLKELKSVQPQGPYFFLGHCFGGQVAFELTRQLEQQGERVAVLVILDVTAPTLEEEEDATRNWSETFWLLYFLELLEKETDVTFDLTQEMLESQETLDQRYELAMRRIKQRDVYFTATAESDQLRAMVRIFKANIRAYINYRFPGVINAPIVLFRAQDQVWGEDDTLGEDWNWGQCTSGEMQVRWTPGTHVNMLSEPHVKDFAAQLRHLLDSKA